MKSKTTHPLLLGLAVAALGLMAGGAEAQNTGRRAANPEIRIDLDHILEGGINGRGELVGMHHEPSAPERLKYQGEWHDIRFRYTSDGDGQDVRTARVELVNPKTGRVVLEKFSTCFPADWPPEDIEACVRDAYEDAKARKRVESNGRWSGYAKDGKRIDGYLTRDNRAIATAFPVLPPPGRGGDRRNGGRP